MHPKIVPLMNALHFDKIKGEHYQKVTTYVFEPD